MTAIKTASDLRYKIEETNQNKHYFTRETMRYFGDTMRNYGVRQPVEVTTQCGEKVRVYELFRRRPVKHNNRASSFWCAETFRRVFPTRD